MIAYLIIYLCIDPADSFVSSTYQMQGFNKSDEPTFRNEIDIDVLTSDIIRLTMTHPKEV